MNRILTTHVGSLPRGPAVVEFLLKRERDESYDVGEFDRTMADAVSEAVRRQVATGIDIVSDGETSKIGYATYIKDRLCGFDGDNPRQVARDLRPRGVPRAHGGVCRQAVASSASRASARSSSSSGQHAQGPREPACGSSRRIGRTRRS